MRVRSCVHVHTNYFALTPRDVFTVIRPSARPPAESLMASRRTVPAKHARAPPLIFARRNARYPRELRFTLLKQRLLELVRRGETEEALSFATERLAPESAGDPVTLRQVEEAVTLLAFEVRLYTRNFAGAPPRVDGYVRCPTWGLNCQ